MQFSVHFISQQFDHKFYCIFHLSNYFLTILSQKALRLMFMTWFRIHKSNGTLFSSFNGHYWKLNWQIIMDMTVDAFVSLLSIGSNSYSMAVKALSSNHTDRFFRKINNINIFLIRFAYEHDPIAIFIYDHICVIFMDIIRKSINH